MNRLFRRLLRWLPKSLSHRLVRRSLRIPQPGESRFTFKLAETREELERAYKLLHDCYVGFGLMKPHSSGLRCTLFSALPTTTVLIAKDGERVIATVSMIRDSEVGFPSDKEYKAENDLYRKQGRRIVEVSALAVDPDYRNLGHFVSIQLMTFLYRYASEFMNADLLCATIHPRALPFYEGVWGFRQNGRVVEYGYVSGALAVHITVDISVRLRNWMAQAYSGHNPRQNLAAFVESDAPTFRFPSRSSPVVLHPVLTPELLRYFFLEKTGLLAELTESERSLVHSAYLSFFHASRLPFSVKENPRDRYYRYATALEASLATGLPPRPAMVRDISAGGIFLETDEPLRIGECYEIFLRVGGEEVIKTLCKVQWQNVEREGQRGSLRHPSGYGLSFVITDLRIMRLIRDSHQKPLPEKFPRSTNPKKLAS